MSQCSNCSLGFIVIPVFSFLPLCFKSWFRPYHSIEILHPYHLIFKNFILIRPWFRFVVDFCYPLRYVNENRVSYALLHLILFNVFFFTFVNDKVVTYVKNLFEKKSYYFKAYILLVQTWIMKAMNLISIKGLLLTIFIPIRHYGFIVLKLNMI